MIALIEFQTLAAIEAFAADPAYAPYLKMRQVGTDSKFVAIDDSGVAGTIPYLRQGS